MSEPSVAAAAIAANDSTEPSAKEKVLGNAANEIVFAVVGHVGSGTSEIAAQLRQLLMQGQLPGGAFDAEIIKARDVIEEWANKNGFAVPHTRNDVNTTIALQELGDRMRATAPDYGAVAEGVARRIRRVRAEKLGVTPAEREAVLPDGKRRAYIVDSIRHPSEVELLRHIYQDAFVLIGVVCEEEIRIDRLTNKYGNAGRVAALDLMARDAKGASKNGQRVSDAFHLADFFIDNSLSRTVEGGQGNPDWHVIDHLSRLVKIVTHAEVVRPSIAETAMHHAYSASMRSACLSRQVGAALIDKNGNVVATGTNEAPRAGGGVYGESFNEHAPDHRCAYAGGFCRNTFQQHKMITDLIGAIPELHQAPPERKALIAMEIRSSGIGDLLEFSRAVHAEMDALLSAARIGKSTMGCRLFVTAFPCHYCARHVVSAGVDEVQYIEPYPKSQALRLHEDSIQTTTIGWSAPSVVPDGAAGRVLFRPFVGVAPRMYRRAFLKDRELKIKDTGLFNIGQPDWGTPWHLRAAGYADLESKLGAAGTDASQVEAPA
ncbi:anti-phage dCTP deaminase [Phenylobacterium sp.]|uniref:anti-phage dCTP deaminase n=1 Tax=Phenylobacterium sp. TaxID=1871053 RepID=UPI002737EF35|nr:anti-phage dCTP deaminase [Phenylobacterium sp.]MDP3868022.1 anti-phage dCTP deaminase [Phenylobacterium sp.]